MQVYAWVSDLLLAARMSTHAKYLRRENAVLPWDSVVGLFETRRLLLRGVTRLVRSGTDATLSECERFRPTTSEIGERGGYGAEREREVN